MEIKVHHNISDLYKTLGLPYESDLQVFPIGLGTMGMSEFYGETNEGQSIKTIHKAIDFFKWFNFISKKQRDFNIF